MRQLDPKDTENLAEIAWRYKDKGVAGFDLAGPEYGFRSKTHKVPRCTPTPRASVTRALTERGGRDGTHGSPRSTLRNATSST